MSNVCGSELTVKLFTHTRASVSKH